MEKTTNFSGRTSKELKQLALSKVKPFGFRSLSTLVETAVREYLENRGVDIEQEINVIQAKSQS